MNWGGWGTGSQANFSRAFLATCDLALSYPRWTEPCLSSFSRTAFASDCRKYCQLLYVLAGATRNPTSLANYRGSKEILLEVKARFGLLILRHTESILLI